MTERSSFGAILLFLCLGWVAGQTKVEELTPAQYLQQLLKVLPPDRTTTPTDQLTGTPPPRVSPEDFTWRDWIRRSNELPPDFAKLPSLPFLPDPLVLDEGGSNLPVTTMDDWNRKRDWIRRQAQHWITGTVPPPPDNLEVHTLSETKRGPLKERTVELRFGPGKQASLHVNLIFPPGEGPFPVFMCPWKKEREDWIQIALRRGYLACRFTATDPKYGYPDDSEAYEELWWPQYDFSTLMRWGWGASRAVDYLYRLPEVDREKISLAGLSRNGKAALWAAAYDERFKATVCISGGTGGEDPFRYTADKYNNETMELLTWYRPHWLHPRLRFFVGREHKLPVDQNLLMALVAPRALMVTSAITESAGNPWGIEQAFRSAKKAFDFLGVGDRLAIHLRHGLHSPSARDLEEYLDFFDFAFGRGGVRPTDKLFYNYSFSRWMGLSGEMIDPTAYPERGIDDLLKDSAGKKITNVQGWEQKRAEVRQRIRWALGEKPPSLPPGPQPDYMREVVGFPRVGKSAGQRPISFGTLYYPANGQREPSRTDLPVILYLHEYSHSKGFSKAGGLINRFVEAGYAVYVFDQIGFGTRIEEGRLFYERFPNWAKMGRMVADVEGAVDELSKLDFLDSKRIYVVGYSLGATVGLYSATLSDRLAGVISVCGFSPMRLDKPGKTAEGIYGYSHLHGLIPRLGFFVGNESRIPYDFHEILAAIAPRPLLILAPTWDQFASFPDVKHCVEEAGEIYRFYDAQESFELIAPEDYNRFSAEMLATVVEWAKKHFP